MREYVIDERELPAYEFLLTLRECVLSQDVQDGDKIIIYLRKELGSVMEAYILKFLGRGVEVEFRNVGTICEKFSFKLSKDMEDVWRREQRVVFMPNR